MSEKKKKRFKMPHSFVIVFTIIVAAVAMRMQTESRSLIRLSSSTWSALR